jgi:hypothetical protein
MGQTVTRQVFVADDGTEFTSKADMQLYEADMRYAGLAAKFADDLDYSDKKSEAAVKRAQTMSRDLATLVLQWLEDNGCLTDNALTLSAQLQAKIVAEREARRQANKEARKTALAAARAAKQASTVSAVPAPAVAGMA